MAHAGGGGGGSGGRGLSGARWGRSGSAGHEKLPVHVSGALALPREPRRPAPRPQPGPRPAPPRPLLHAARDPRPLTSHLGPLGGRPVPLPARDLRPQFPPLTRAHRDRPLPLSPSLAGGGRPHLPGPGEDPLRQRPCYLQRLPGNYEGVQKPKVPVGPLPTPGGRRRAERVEVPQLRDLVQVVEPLEASVSSKNESVESSFVELLWGFLEGGQVWG